MTVATASHQASRRESHADWVGQRSGRLDDRQDPVEDDAPEDGRAATEQREHREAKEARLRRRLAKAVV